MCVLCSRGNMNHAVIYLDFLIGAYNSVLQLMLDFITAFSGFVCDFIT